MAGEARVMFIGNLGSEPELRFTPAGVAVVNISVGVQERRKDGDQWVDGDTTWYRCNAWRQLAENVAESLNKGDRVVVIGTVKQRKYEARDGGTGYSLEVEVEGVGPDLRFATAKSNRVRREQGGQPQGGQGGGSWDNQPQGGGQQRQRSNQGGQYDNRGQQGQFGGAPADDPWGSAPARQGGGGGYADEPPF